MKALFDGKFNDYLEDGSDDLVDDMVDDYASYIGKNGSKHQTISYQIKGKKLILIWHNKTGKMVAQVTYEKLSDSQAQDAKDTYSQEKEKFEEYDIN